MIVVTVARKPLSAPNVAANTLAHGTGALHIEASRIQTSDDLNGGAYSAGAGDRHDGAENWRYKRGELGNAGEFKPPSGRWPANLVLEHLPECTFVGRQSVRSNGHYPSARGKGSEVSGPSGHGGQEGLVERHTDGEVVSVWACASGCPVAELDAQTADLQPSKGAYVRKHGDAQFLGSGLGDGRVDRPTGVSDAGGASRFFKQVGGRR